MGDKNLVMGAITGWNPWFQVV